ncbi:uncharacterized protein LOC109716344 [Ananas comosus]|uniref:Uncharacterized protein LOC109716344 n=2 Tax=Ananas comosus TaxID=4615 RepID=A0A6P5FWB1_ANACO|nr:uncharacterized protein LOC109716344 [Ananas comosus]CAD1843320.1 unnamed protein product [Ananas comosus var. bracteatus]
MNQPNQTWYILSILFFFFFFLLSFAQTAHRNASFDSLDSVIRDHAFETILTRRSGQLYQVPLPSNLSGIEASTVRLRGSYLWSSGANSTSFHIPPRTSAVPFAKRLVLVFENFGNFSASYFSVPLNHTLATLVLGLLAYDASNLTSGATTELKFEVLGDSISITFHEFKLPERMNNVTAKCASFGPNRSVRIHDLASENTCTATSTGHFAIVVSSDIRRPEGRERGGVVLVIACGVGAVGLVLVGLVGILGLVKLRRDKKREREIEEGGEGLGVVWVRRSKMPCATMVRTQAIIEDSISVSTTLRNPYG